jgi:hypothetical protein
VKVAPHAKSVNQGNINQEWVTIHVCPAKLVTTLIQRGLRNVKRVQLERCKVKLGRPHALTVALVRFPQIRGAPYVIIAKRGDSPLKRGPPNVLFVAVGDIKTLFGSLHARDRPRVLPKVSKDRLVVISVKQGKSNPLPGKHSAVSAMLERFSLALGN